jgi:hypothetical protein
MGLGRAIQWRARFAFRARAHCDAQDVVAMARAVIHLVDGRVEQQRVGAIVPAPNASRPRAVLN